MVDSLSISEPWMEEIQIKTREDTDLQTLKDVILGGWPDTQKDVPAEIRPYFNIRDELSFQDGIIFRSSRAVIPKSLRSNVLARVHRSHIGREGCLRRARESIYWPGMSAQVKDLVAKCDTCRSTDHEQQKEPLHGHDVPNRPWSKVATDLFVFDNRNYAITVDYFSNFWEIDFLQDTRSSTIINKLKGQFARYGIQDICVSDNGPQYSSEEFRQFASDWSFKHVTSSPAYPQSNGKAEQAVKTAKCLLLRAKLSKNDPFLAILDFRNTPTQGIDASPVQRLMSRRTRTLLPTAESLLIPKTPVGTLRKLQDNKKKQQYYYNKDAKPLAALKPADVVRITPRTLNSKQWLRGEVVGPANTPRSYEVRTETGGILRRNRRHLRLTRESMEPHDPEDSRDADIQATRLDTTTSCDTQVDNHSDTNTPTSVTHTRSGRAIKKPGYLEDYET